METIQPQLLWSLNCEDFSLHLSALSLSSLCCYAAVTPTPLPPLYEECCIGIIRSFEKNLIFTES